MSTNLSKIRPWIFYFLAWTAVGMLYLAQNVTRRYFWDDPRPWQDLHYWAAQVYLSALLTPLILWAGRRWPLERQNWPKLVGIHLLLSIAWGLTRLSLEAVFHISWNHYFPPQTYISPLREVQLLLLFSLHTAIVAYWVVLIIQSSFRNYARFQERAQAALRLDLRASQLDTQITQARLGALKAQLQPHFLFNTLNAIVVLVRQQKGKQAEETLARFSDLLRAVLVDMEAQEVPLSRELEYLKLYLSIEELRFSDRLRVTFDVDPELLDTAVPHMALQPLVENAIRHGIGQRASSGNIVIRARRIGDRLHVEVQDDGPGFAASNAAPGSGIGLSNTRARLKQLYGDRSELRTATPPQGGAMVTLVLPFHLLGEPAHA